MTILQGKVKGSLELELWKKIFVKNCYIEIKTMYHLTIPETPQFNDFVEHMYTKKTEKL